MSILFVISVALVILAMFNFIREPFAIALMIVMAILSLLWGSQGGEEEEEEAARVVLQWVTHGS